MSEIYFMAHSLLNSSSDDVVDIIDSSTSLPLKEIY